MGKLTLPKTAMAHNFVVLKEDTNLDSFVNSAIRYKENGYIPSSKEDEIVFSTSLVAGGETEEFSFTTPSDPGSYPFVCTFPGHYAAGGKGILIVSNQ